MKRVLAFLLIAVILVSIIPAAYAAERGDTITITFNTSGNPGFKNFKATINYPTDALELTSIVAGSLCSTGMPMPNAATGEFAFAGFMPVTGDGSVFTATFAVKDKAPAGTYNVSATLNYAYGANSENVSFGITGDSVTVTVPPCPDNAHDWVWDESKCTSPTCTEPGITVGTCRECGTYFEGTVDALGHEWGTWTKVDDAEHKRVCSRGCTETDEHNWNGGEITTQPTCKNPGVKTFTCADCNGTKTETVDATGEHVYTNWTKVSDTKHEGTCGCGEKKQEDHKWDAGKITTEPTCNKTGVKTYTCSVCSGTKTETVAATGDHNYTNWTKVNDDKHEGTCGCGEKIQKDHKWDAGKITTEPTCKNPGVKTFTCADCKGTKTESVAATGKHVYTASYKDNGDGNTHTGVCACGTENPTKEQHELSPKETINPDCKNDGKKIYQCTLCNAKFEETLPSTGNHNYETWKSDGEKTHTSTCTGCNSEKKTEDHIWNKGEITKQPTCKEEGVKTFTCTAKGCGETKTEAIAKTTNHTYGDWTPVEGTDNHEHVCTVCNTAKETKAHEWKLKEKVAATCVAEGKEDYTCICGAEKTVVLPVDKDAHKLGYTKNEETENHTVFCENEGCTLAPFFEEHNHNIFGDRVGNKQEKLCACGDKITEVVKSNSADLDDVPKTGDITGQIVAFVVCGLAAMMAVAFTFKRKAVK